MGDLVGDLMVRPGSVLCHSHLDSIAQKVGIGSQLNLQCCWEIRSCRMPRKSTHGWREDLAVRWVVGDEILCSLQREG